MPKPQPWQMPVVCSQPMARISPLRNCATSHGTQKPCDWQEMLLLDGSTWISVRQLVSMRKTFVPPAPQSVRPVVAPMILTVLGLVLAFIGLLADNLKGAAILGVLAIVLLLVTLVEFSEMRDRHRARRAIEQSAGTNQPEPQPVLLAAPPSDSNSQSLAC